MALSLIKLKNNIEAKKIIKKAININPNKGDFYQILGYLNIEKSKKSKDLNLAKKSLDIFNSAFELKKNKMNYKNYWNCRKFVFLLKNKNLEEKKLKLKIYFKHLYNEKFFKKNECKNIPKYFNCGINRDLMENPFHLTSGNSYEKNELLKYIEYSDEVNGFKDPITRVSFNKNNIFGNKVLKKVICRYLKKQPWAFEFEDRNEDLEKIVFEVEFKFLLGDCL